MRLLGAAGLALVVVAVDQLTKSWAVRALADGEQHVWWLLQWNLSYNHGAAFGLGRGVTPIILGIGIVMVVALLGLGRLAAERWLGAVALGLLLGGAVGNLIDRLFRDTGGAVVDFIDFWRWPIFNIADIGITVGAGLFVLAARGAEPSEPEAAEPEAAES